MPFKNLDDYSEQLLAASRAADPRWVEVRRLADQAKPLVPKDRQDFFQANILTQADLHLHFNRMVIDLMEMAQTAERTAKIAKLQSAIRECEAAASAMHSAEYGKWKNFYTTGDWLLNTPLTLALEREYLNQLEGRPVSEDVLIRVEDTGFPYHMITAYQGTQTVFGIETRL